MNRLNCWVCTLVTAFFASLLVFGGLGTAFAETLKVVAAEPRLANGLVTDEHMAPRVVFEETFTKTNASAGWDAWRRQSREYKKANPWEKVLAANCAREPRICAKAAPPDTKFYLPATNVRVLAPVVGNVPEAIALIPTNLPGVHMVGMAKPAESNAASVGLKAELAAAQDVAIGLQAKNDFMKTITMLMLIAIGLLVLIMRIRAKQTLIDECQKYEIAKGDLVIQLYEAREHAKTNASRMKYFPHSLPAGVRHKVFGGSLMLKVLGTNDKGEMFVESPLSKQQVTVSELDLEIINARNDGHERDGFMFSWSEHADLSVGRRA